MADGGLEIAFDKNSKLKITMIIASLKIKNRKKNQIDLYCAIFLLHIFGFLLGNHVGYL